MKPLSELLQQFSARYHKALVARAALIAGLGSGCCALLAWRLILLKVSALASVSLAAGLVAVLFAALSFWLRKRWLPRKEAAAYLDRSLGLEQRLVTAEEFSESPKSSALYPALISDLSQQAAGRQLKTPRPWNRASSALAVALLLLLLWPQLNAILPLSLRQPEPAKPPKQEDQNGRQQQPPDARQQAGTSSQQSNSNSSSGANQQQQAGGGNSQPANNGESKNNQQAGGQQSPSGAPKQNPSSDSGGSQTSSSQTGAGQSKPAGLQPQSNQPKAGQGSSDNRPSSGNQPQSAQAGTQQQQSASKSGSGSEGQQGSAGAQQATAQQNAQNQGQQGGSGQQTRSGARQNVQSKSGQSAGSGPKQESPAAREGEGSQGLGQSMGDSAELKADIQQLLKEMSGELKELQGQLEAAKDQPKPQAGSGTDPNLYGAGEKLDALGSKSPVPLSLGADQKATEKAGRPAGGVGKASSDISSELPQAQAQQAQLSDQPSEESASTRQSVPIEYRNVFDQLRKHEEQPSGGKNQ